MTSTNRTKQTSTKGSTASQGHIPQIFQSRGQRHFIKLDPRSVRSHGEAGSQAAGRHSVTSPLPI
jgi:hypothetical protein